VHEAVKVAREECIPHAVLHRHDTASDELLSFGRLISTSNFPRFQAASAYRKADDTVNLGRAIAGPQDQVCYSALTTCRQCRVG
jgi:hypothetical protein